MDVEGAELQKVTPYGQIALVRLTTRPLAIKVF